MKRTLFLPAAFLVFCLLSSFTNSSSSPVNALPPQTIVFPDIYICEGSSTFLNQTGCGYDAYLWDNGASTQSIEVFGAGTYRVEIWSDAFSFIKEFNVYTLPAPVVDITGDAYLCFGGATTLTATPGYASYQWRDANGDINGATSNTLQVSAVGIYTVVVGNEDKCFTEVSHTVVVGTELLLEVTATGACAGAGAAQVNVSGGLAPYSYLWSNGATTAQIENLNAGTYTVVVTDAAGCTAQESVVVASSQYCTRLWIAHCDQEYNNLSTLLLLSPPVSAALRYRWSFVDESGVEYFGWIDGSERYFRLQNAYNTAGEQLYYNQKYEVTIQVEYLDLDGHVVLGGPGEACTIILGNPKTQLWSAHCNQEYNNLNTLITLQPTVVGAIRYRWSFVDPNGLEYFGWLSSPSTYFRLQNAYTANGVQLVYDETYTVTIQVEYEDKNGNVVLAAAGPACQITLGNPKTQLWSAHCNQEYNNLNTLLTLHPSVVGAIRYRWSFVDPNGLEYFGWLSSPSTYFRLQNAYTANGVQLVYDETYTVTIQVEYEDKNGNVVLAAAGPACQITLGNPKTQLWSAHCNQEYNNLNTLLTLQPSVVGAIRYRWSFVDGNGLEYFGWLSSPSTYFRLQNAYTANGVQLVYDETYTVTIQVEYEDKNGNIVLASAGPACNINLGSPSPFANEQPQVSDQLESSEDSENKKKYELRVFPNPAVQQSINLHFEGISTNSQIAVEVRNVSGKLVLRIPQATTKTQLEINDLSPGIYFINAKVDGEYLQEKLLIFSNPAALD